MKAVLTGETPLPRSKRIPLLDTSPQFGLTAHFATQVIVFLSISQYGENQRTEDPEVREPVLVDSLK